MGKRYFLAALLILVYGSVSSRPADQGRPASPELQWRNQFSPMSAAPQFTSSLNETIYFGGTTWATDSVRWEALVDSVWTFDSGVGSVIKVPGYSNPYVDPTKPDGFHAYMEGWVGVDYTSILDTPYFRRISSADPRWHSSVCVGSAGGLGGDYSFWAGVFPDEADSLGFVAGQGYGDNWKVCLGQAFYYPPGGGHLTLEYDYSVETEPGFDYVRVFVEKGGSESTVAEYDGVISGHESLTLSPGSDFPGSPDSMTIKFCFDSDGAWSDEDGMNPTSCGAFVLDNIALSGAIVHAADFETDDGGWSRDVTPLTGPFDLVNPGRC